MSIEKAKERIISARKSVRLQHLGWGKIFEQEIAQALSELSQQSVETAEQPEPIYGIDRGKPGGDLTCEVEGHKEGDVLVVDSVKYSKPEPPEPSEFTKDLREKATKRIWEVKHNLIKPEIESIFCIIKQQDILEACDILDRLEAENKELKRIGPAIQLSKEIDKKEEIIHQQAERVKELEDALKNIIKSTEKFISVSNVRLIAEQAIKEKKL